ncbi:uncharacterized protein LOC111398693 [Olea europaea var. sylvestris]|uniref:uncharacterized protein LOC111398693 n=1 Tax=Olea europaea var. sylvestris TaxID=158386 RepID=UPI000C1D121B|nr:uncharacterized protein LOC111398693 [Olea europaea var. sylvestris]XP_022881495.1 uncharacterized protein LOC111398693 [Olea europaea var. sylvestris]XP_022881496.1 uncharacterized protein LOC111398693 [Olea europaea var. sylvestris]XP_022881497.1 uncharacterized protein LOC111398693 [Olea europaea var. sylvestris]XP_022881498.1 uncharacterized protein LOC111398693 [Olea europaea var. sylvestris]XP_022881500.1 uncharacterized protein LOC111398693 [Olea europaea var. sylvestris]
MHYRLNSSNGCHKCFFMMIVRYLNNKKEMHLKRMLCEAMIKEHEKVKKQNAATKTKKTTSAGKAVKTIEKLEQRKRSSRINYDALRLLNDDIVSSRINADTNTRFLEK